VVELGVVRAVEVSGERVTVRMTPTFSGCPALHVMAEEIGRAISALGVADVVVETVLYPPWSSDWITAAGRAKLKQFGLAPPPRHGGRIELALFDAAACPYCDSTNPTVKNTFGSTLCRAIHFCNDCRQPFEQFKPL
jgi:ring-1,2-phenylacetyl-CoA epoxidase subunit PaaD